jgi:hypothetical protein
VSSPWREDWAEIRRLTSGELDASLGAQREHGETNDESP